MIRVTRLDGAEVVVNCDLVQWIERTPDTLILLTNGERLFVKESAEEVVLRALDFKRAVAAGPTLRAGDAAEQAGY